MIRSVVGAVMGKISTPFWTLLGLRAEKEGTKSSWDVPKLWGLVLRDFRAWDSGSGHGGLGFRI